MDLRQITGPRHRLSCRSAPRGLSAKHACAITEWPCPLCPQLQKSCCITVSEANTKLTSPLRSFRRIEIVLPGIQHRGPASASLTALGAWPDVTAKVVEGVKAMSRLAATRRRSHGEPWLEAKTGVKPRSPKGRAPARGLDGRLCLQHPFMRAG